MKVEIPNKEDIVTLHLESFTRYYVKVFHNIVNTFAVCGNYQEHLISMQKI